MFHSYIIHNLSGLLPISLCQLAATSPKGVEVRFTVAIGALMRY